MRFLRNHNTDPYFNMAFDEYALERLVLDEPLFFLWQNQPSVIVGLNQNVHNEVNLDYLKSEGILLARRVTGGGAVYHDWGNLNYTIVGRTVDLDRDYPEYARYVLYALRELGVEAELSGRNDILVSGRKVSGYAKRVYKDRLMVHGTLMYNVDISVLEKVLTPSDEKFEAKGIASVRSRVVNLKNFLPKDIQDIAAFRDRIERILSRGYRDGQLLLTRRQLLDIADIARRKFATEEWIYEKRNSGRTADSSVHCVRRSGHFSCGRVEAYLMVESGRIVQCRFYGDFLGSIPVNGLELSLRGVLYEYEALQKHLSQIDVFRYFDSMEYEELLRLLRG